MSRQHEGPLAAAALKKIRVEQEKQRQMAKVAMDLHELLNVLDAEMQRFSRGIGAAIRALNVQPPDPDRDEEF